MNGVKLSEHFSLYEARCRCGCKVEAEYIPELKAQAERNESFRADLNEDGHLIDERLLAGGKFRLIPMSWIRCSIHNKAEGGADASRHLPYNCDATDLACPELPTETLYKKAQKHYNRVIWYRGRNFVHCDNKPGPPQYWVKAPSKTIEPATA